MLYDKLLKKIKMEVKSFGSHSVPLDELRAALETQKKASEPWAVALLILQSWMHKEGLTFERDERTRAYIFRNQGESTQ